MAIKMENNEILEILQSINNEDDLNNFLSKQPENEKQSVLNDLLFKVLNSYVSDNSDYFIKKIVLMVVNGASFERYSDIDHLLEHEKRFSLYDLVENAFRSSLDQKRFELNNYFISLVKPHNVNTIIKKLHEYGSYQVDEKIFNSILENITPENIDYSSYKLYEFLYKNKALSSQNSDHVKQYICHIEKENKKRSDLIHTYIADSFIHEYPHLLPYEEFILVDKDDPNFSDNVKSRSFEEEKKFLQYTQSKEFYETYPNSIAKDIYHNMMFHSQEFIRSADWFYLHYKYLSKMVNDIKKLGFANGNVKCCIKEIAYGSKGGDKFSPYLEKTIENLALSRAYNGDLEKQIETLENENQDLKNQNKFLEITNKELTNKMSFVEKSKQRVNRSNSL